MNDRSKVILGCFGMGCVCAMEITALIMKIDGVYLSVAVGAVTTIIGACLGIVLTKK